MAEFKKLSAADRVMLPFNWDGEHDGGLKHASFELGFEEDYLERQLRGQACYRDGLETSPLVLSGALSILDKKPKKVEIHFEAEGSKVSGIKMILADWGNNVITICTNTSVRHYAGAEKFGRDPHRLFCSVDFDKKPILIPCCKMWRRDISDRDLLTNSETYFQGNEDAEDADAVTENAATEAAGNDEAAAAGGGWGNENAAATNGGWGQENSAATDGAADWGTANAEVADAAALWGNENATNGVLADTTNLPTIKIDGPAEEKIAEADDSAWGTDGAGGGAAW